MSTPTDHAAGYDLAGQAWEEGPGRLIYNRLAQVLVECSPVELSGRLVLDLGAGTGAGSRAVEAAGGRPIATDIARGMLSVDAADRPPAAVADACALPFGAGIFGAVVAAFCLNHLKDPSLALREAARVLDSEGALLVSAYAGTDGHFVKEAVERALRESGWQEPSWQQEMKHAAATWSTVDLAVKALQDAGLRVLTAEYKEVPFPHLTRADLVNWRLGMAPAAWYVTGLDLSRRRALTSRCEELLEDAPPLVRRVILVAAGSRR